jgi:hypothetical protein
VDAVSRNLLLNTIPTEMFDAVVVAPCGSDQVHVVGAEVLQEDYVVQVARGQTTLKRRDNGLRGSRVTLKFYDENNHYFTVDVQFYKGQTFVSRSGCSPFVEPPEELWRS